MVLDTAELLQRFIDRVFSAGKENVLNLIVKQIKTIIVIKTNKVEAQFYQQDTLHQRKVSFNYLSYFLNENWDHCELEYELPSCQKETY